MNRHTPVQIEVSNEGKFFALRAEKQLIAITVYRKGAETIEALIRGMIYYSSRNAFRIALENAINPKPKAEKPKKGVKTEAAATAPATEPPAPPVNGNVTPKGIKANKPKKPRVNKNRLEHQLKEKRAELAAKN